MNQLKFDFLAFKSLTELHLKKINVSPDIVTSVGLLRNTLQTLAATECHLKSISQILLCDLNHSEEDLTLDFVKGGTHCWSQLLILNVRQGLYCGGTFMKFNSILYNITRLSIFLLSRDSISVIMTYKILTNPSDLLQG